MVKPGLVALTLLVLFYQSLTGCAYHFANSKFQPPPGIRTLYIESIYDTSKASVPHHMIWNALQREFGADGRVILAGRKSAVAYMQIHLEKATKDQFDKGTIAPDREFSMEDDPLPKPSEKPSKIRKLGQAGEFAKKELLALGVRITVYSRKSRKVIYTKLYGMSQAYDLIDREPNTQFLRANEAFLKAFGDISNNLAKQVRNDFLRL